MQAPPARVRAAMLRPCERCVARSSRSPYHDWSSGGRDPTEHMTTQTSRDEQPRGRGAVRKSPEGKWIDCRAARLGRSYAKRTARQRRQSPRNFLDTPSSLARSKVTCNVATVENAGI